jgi:hypothetical protein
MSMRCYWMLSLSDGEQAIGRRSHNAPASTGPCSACACQDLCSAGLLRRVWGRAALAPSRRAAQGSGDALAATPSRRRPRVPAGSATAQAPRIATVRETALRRPHESRHQRTHDPHRSRHRLRHADAPLLAAGRAARRIRSGARSADAAVREVRAGSGCWDRAVVLFPGPRRTGWPARPRLPTGVPDLAFGRHEGDGLRCPSMDGSSM